VPTGHQYMNRILYLHDTLDTYARFVSSQLLATYLPQARARPLGVYLDPQNSIGSAQLRSIEYFDICTAGYRDRREQGGLPPSARVTDLNFVMGKARNISNMRAGGSSPHLSMYSVPSQHYSSFGKHGFDQDVRYHHPAVLCRSHWTLGEAECDVLTQLRLLNVDSKDPMLRIALLAMRD